MEELKIVLPTLDELIHEENYEYNIPHLIFTGQIGEEEIVMLVKSLRERIDVVNAAITYLRDNKRLNFHARSLIPFFWERDMADQLYQILDTENEEAYNINWEIFEDAVKASKNLTSYRCWEKLRGLGIPLELKTYIFQFFQNKLGNLEELDFTEQILKFINDC